MSSVFPGLELGDEVSEVMHADNCSVLKIENETGEGIMTCYMLFPGVVVMYNDFHMSYCDTSFEIDGQQMLCVDHCREGSMERFVRPEVYYYFSPGNCAVDVRRYHAGRTNFPQNHFHGVSIGFYLPQASEQLVKELRGFPVSLESLRQKFCADGEPNVLSKSEEAERIFHTFYTLPKENRREYLRLKIFELLLHLDGLDTGNIGIAKPYFYKSQVDKIKAAERLITENLTKSYTIVQLAERFDISQSALKSCFKEIFGLPINTYLQEHRIRRAAVLLREDQNLSVSQAAGMVGYDSPGKFAAIFKRIYGVTPREYQRGGLL